MDCSSFSSSSVRVSALGWAVELALDMTGAATTVWLLFPHWVLKCDACSNRRAGAPSAVQPKGAGDEPRIWTGRSGACGTVAQLPLPCSDVLLLYGVMILPSYCIDERKHQADTLRRADIVFSLPRSVRLSTSVRSPRMPAPLAKGQCLLAFHYFIPCIIMPCSDRVVVA